MRGVWEGVLHFQSSVVGQAQFIKDCEERVAREEEKGRGSVLPEPLSAQGHSTKPLALLTAPRRRSSKETSRWPAENTTR